MFARLTQVAAAELRRLHARRLHCRAPASRGAIRPTGTARDGSTVTTAERRVTPVGTNQVGLLELMKLKT